MTTRAELAALPVPVGPDGEPAEACVTYDEGRYQVAWLLGTRKVPSGLTFDKPREACRASAWLNRRNNE